MFCSGFEFRTSLLCELIIDKIYHLFEKRSKNIQHIFKRNKNHIRLLDLKMGVINFFALGLNIIPDSP